MIKEPEKLLITRGPLLNFWLAPFWLPHPCRDELFCYPGVEWRFQAYKALFIVAASTRMQARLHDKIASAKTAHMAKMLGRELDPFDSNKWNKYAYNVMLTANLAKFTQHSPSRKALSATGSKILIEHRRDSIWGDNIDGSGKNWHGDILQKVRAVL